MQSSPRPDGNQTPYVFQFRTLTCELQPISETINENSVPISNIRLKLQLNRARPNLVFGNTASRSFAPIHIDNFQDTQSADVWDPSPFQIPFPNYDFSFIIRSKITITYLQYLLAEVPNFCFRGTVKN